MEDNLGDINKKRLIRYATL